MPCTVFANQPCISGPVDERMKYGRPMQIASRVIMWMIGFSVPVGFHVDSGMIFTVATAAIMRIVWTITWRRVGRCETMRWAYR